MHSIWSKKFKLITIIRIVEALLDRGEVEEANRASIILKTAMICDELGIEKAMEYYDGTHDIAEFAEFIVGDNAPVCSIPDQTRHTGVEAPVGRFSKKTRPTGKLKEDKCTTL